MNEQLRATPIKTRQANFRDLTGRRFGRLTAIRPTGEKAVDGCYFWQCRCDCGKTAVVRSNKLLQGYTQSCDCYRNELLRASKTYIGGTCLEIVNSCAISKNNTSGVKGVSRNSGQWLVKISLSRRQFFLGRYDDFDIAREVYNEAEEIRRSITYELDVLGDSAADVLADRVKELRDKYRPYMHAAAGEKRSEA